MKLAPWRSILPLAGLLVFGPPVWSQSSPHVGFVYPAGGRPGSTFEVKIGGQYLDGTTSLHVSGEGVEAKILGQTKPLTQKEINTLRDKLKELEKKKPRTDADRKEIEEIHQQLAKEAIRPTPVLAAIAT